MGRIRSHQKGLCVSIRRRFFDNFVSKNWFNNKFGSQICPCYLSDIFRVLFSKLEILHVFTMLYHLQLNTDERVNRTLIQMILSYIGLHHTNWVRFCSTLLMLFVLLYEWTGKILAEIFLLETLSHPFKVWSWWSGNKFVCQD